MLMGTGPAEGSGRQRRSEVVGTTVQPGHSSLPLPRPRPGCTSPVQNTPAGRQVVPGVLLRISWLLVKTDLNFFTCLLVSCLSSFVTGLSTFFAFFVLASSTSSC